jgi:hypothetical protein
LAKTVETEEAPNDCSHEADMHFSKLEYDFWQMVDNQ